MPKTAKTTKAKAKKNKVSDIPFEDNDLRYAVEPASTGRSKCKRCKEVIEKGDLRFGSSTSGGMFPGSWFWHHLACASSSQVSNCMSTYGQDLARVPFFASLSDEHKTAVREHFE